MSTTDTSITVEPLDERGSAVRFETQCIVIPDPAHNHSRLPRVVTKSYTLPALWKRRTSSAGPSISVSPEDVSCEENQSHLVLRVPVPTFSRKPNSTTRTVDHAPLPPCLVHRPRSTETPLGPSAPSLSRHTRTKTSPSPSRSDVVTVPLRPCCAACQSVTEAALVDGDAWPEHFSRAASRRRSASVDCSPRTITVAGSAASASYGTLGVAISVDEIDKRRRASDSGLSTRPEALWSKHGSAWGGSRAPLIHCRTATSNSNSSFADAHPPPSPSRITPATPRIPEESDDEDESELFPLPSPKRTPTASPAPSVAGSVSSLAVAQPNHSGGTSPTPSTCSGDFAAVLPPNKRHFLAPPCASSSSLSLPRLSGSTTDLGLAEDLPRAPSPTLLSALPSLSGRHRSRSPSPRMAFIPPVRTADVSRSSTDGIPRAATGLTPTRPIPIPPRRGPMQWTGSPPLHSPTQTRFPWRSRRPASADGFLTRPMGSLPSPSSPALSSKSPKSFSVPSPMQLFADVLRGVGSGGGFAPPGM